MTKIPSLKYKNQNNKRKNNQTINLAHFIETIRHSLYNKHIPNDEEKSHFSTSRNFPQPQSKIKKIIQQNQEVGKLSNVVPYLVQRSLQLFLSEVLEKVNEIADANELSKANPSILRKAIEQMPKYQFMKFAVEDLEEFQSIKKKKSEIKNEKIQRKKSAKNTENNENPSQNAPALTAPGKRGRKKLSKEEKTEKVDEEVEKEVEE